MSETASSTASGKRPSPFDLATPNTGPFIHIADLMRRPSPRYLIAGELPEASLIVLYGQASVGKSFVALDYAAQVAARGLSVVYLASEGQSGYAARGNALVSYKQLDPARTPIYFACDPYNLTNTGDIEALLNYMGSLHPALIVVDTLARSMSGDENSAKDMGLFVRGCDLLRTTLNATVMVVHHTGKSGATERGSSALRAAADVMLEVTRNNDIISMECDKFKDGVEFPKRHYRMQVIELTPEGTSCVLVPVEGMGEAQPASQLERHQLQILEALYSKNNGVNTTDLRAMTQIPGTSYHRAMHTLKQGGYVTQNSGNGLYRITLEGSDYLHKEEDETKTQTDQHQKTLF
jgi:hypothetical protein